MNVVGKVSSFITQGMYSVATPFHPFGGAVDIIAVQQQDGSFRSTPWYVRFGKFQGVLKGAEKVVRIEVNGVEANFHMYLDNSGEAYFVREVDPDKDNKRNESPKDSSSCEGTREDGSTTYYNDDDRLNDDELYRKETNDFDNGEVEMRDERAALGVNRLERTESDSSRIFYEFQDEQSSLESSEYGSGRYDSLENMEHVLESQDSNSEVVLVSVDGHILTAPISSSERDTENVQLNTPQFHLGPGEETEDYNNGQNAWTTDYLNDLDSSIHRGASGDAQEVNNGIASEHQLQPSEAEGEHLHDLQETQHSANQIDLMNGNSEDKSSSLKRDDDVFKSCLELPALGMQSGNADQEEKGSPLGNCSQYSDEKSPQGPLTINENEEKKVGEPRNEDVSSAAYSKSPGRTYFSELQVSVETDENDEIETDRNGPNGLLTQFDSDDRNLEKATDVTTGVMQNGKETPVSNDICSESEDVDPHTAAPSEDTKTDAGPRIEISLCGNLLRAGMGLTAAEEAFETKRITVEEFQNSAASIIKNENLIVRIQGKYLSWEKAAPILLGKVAYGLDLPVQEDDAVAVEQEISEVKEDDSGLTSTPSGRRWRLWPIPFRRVKTLEHNGSGSSNEEAFVDPEIGSQNNPVESVPTPRGGNESPHKQLIRTNIPTTDQIASLNLKEGQNMVKFMFSTRVLGPQKVEAHIYLWKWNTKIVISDVDGTITKSDVLGQFMPLVGKDWTHLGIARLFSAIKENGYQLLFLSARAIVQAYLTKSFLFNLKQDGKSLPNGPVVISPDGLFPSLYREVIRRAPHEFKIACLEDIKALFPPDYNPFYAGFGNRDTDELSYRKIGIPKGKIFIINPKGEVAINHRIDVKSYTSLHTLVHDMFPPTSLVEQEDYNSWNYWKMPLPDIDNL